MQRVGGALDLAAQAVADVVAPSSESSEVDVDLGRLAAEDPQQPAIRPLLRAKIVAETTMLLRCAARICLGNPLDIQSRADALQSHACDEALGPVLCREPDLAIEHAAAYIHLSGLGYREKTVDELLACALAEPVTGPERLANHELEREWLEQIWSGRTGDGPDQETLSRTCLARPLDAFNSSTLDWYAFTHTVLYATDMGTRTPAWPRQLDLIAADAETGLAAAIDATNYDLAAELLWTWPLMRLPWSPTAAFAFTVLATAHDTHGFLPGPEYRNTFHEALPASLRSGYVLRTSYHATIAMGILCAVAVRHPPPSAVVDLGETVDGIVSTLRATLDDGAQPAWLDAYDELEPSSRDALTGLLQTVALRRAARANDINTVRKILLISTTTEDLDRPAARQGLSLLRRATLLADRLGATRQVHDPTCVACVSAPGEPDVAERTGLPRLGGQRHLKPGSRAGPCRPGGSSVAHPEDAV